MDTYDKYLDKHLENGIHKMVFKTDLIYVLLDSSYVASSLVRKHYDISEPAWQAEHDKLDEYRDLLRQAQSVLEGIETRMRQKIADNNLADETPF
jgi:hypothetical protein